MCMIRRVVERVFRHDRMFSRTPPEGGADRPSSAFENKMSLFVQLRAADLTLCN